MGKSIDELLQAPYWVIDILPGQVPEDSPGQFFAVEKYFLQEERLGGIKQKHINLILKLNCYRRISLGGEGAGNPPPEQIAAEIRGNRACIMVDDSMIVSEPDDTCMALYNPNGKLLDLVRALASGEGLYVWKPPAG